MAETTAPVVFRAGSAAALPTAHANLRLKPETCAVTSKRLISSTPVWASVSKRKPPSRLTMVNP